VELVVLAPVVFVLALVALVFGRVTTAHQQVTESARAAAQMAAVMPTPQAAVAAAADAVNGGFVGTSPCARTWVSTDVSDFHPGGSVTVTVICSVDLSDLSVPGVPGSTSIRVLTTAPVDPYRSVQ
jgi:Ni,Fe-hydrogenase III small subunit